jgi:hypothetical protein
MGGYLGLFVPTSRDPSKPASILGLGTRIGHLANIAPLVRPTKEHNSKPQKSVPRRRSSTSATAHQLAKWQRLQSAALCHFRS